MPAQDRHVVHACTGLPGPAVVPIRPHDLQRLHGSTRAGVELRGNGQMAIRLGHRDELDRVALENIVGTLSFDKRPSTGDDVAGNGSQDRPRDIRGQPEQNQLRLSVASQADRVPARFQRCRLRHELQMHAGTLNGLADLAQPGVLPSGRHKPFPFARSLAVPASLLKLECEPVLRLHTRKVNTDT